jgi:hypothetical protein
VAPAALDRWQTRRLIASNDDRGVNDCIVALGGQDIVDGLGGNDTVFGGAADDDIDGGACHSLLDGRNERARARCRQSANPICAKIWRARERVEFWRAQRSAPCCLRS